MKKDKFIVIHNEKQMYRLNEDLMNRQNCLENLELIKMVHETKLDLYDLIQKEKNLKVIKEHVLNIQECEFELQRLWKFDINANYHRFWETPGCKCPKMDNYDNLGSGFKIISPDCAYHYNTHKLLSR